MLIKTRGIVFRHQRYGETSVITDIYTEAKGLQSYIVSGVRSKKARVSASLLQLMSLVDMVAYFREDKQQLFRTKEIRPAYTFQSIPFDLRKGTVGMFLIEVARKSIREAEGNPTLFEFLFEGIRHLDDTKHSVANFHLGFLLELSGYLGFLPDVEGSDERPIFDLREGTLVQSHPGHPEFLDEEYSLLFVQLIQAGYAGSHEITLQRSQRKHLLDRILDYYRLHIEQFPEIRSLQILEEILG